MGINFPTKPPGRRQHCLPPTAPICSPRPLPMGPRGTKPEGSHMSFQVDHQHNSSALFRLERAYRAGHASGRRAIGLIPQKKFHHSSDHHPAGKSPVKAKSNVEIGLDIDLLPTLPQLRRTFPRIQKFNRYTPRFKTTFPNLFFPALAARSQWLVPSKGPQYGNGRRTSSAFAPDRLSQSAMPRTRKRWQ